MIWMFLAIDLVNGDVLVVNQRNITIHEFVSLSSNFGADIGADGVLGALSIAEPLEACEQIAPASQPVAPVNIVLIQRSFGKNSCPFDKKVYNAQRSNYSAAIIFNDRGEDLITMQPSGEVESDSIKIPSVFVGLRSGKALMRYAIGQNNSNQNETFRIFLRRDEFRGIKFYLIPFVSVLILALVLMMVILILRFIARIRQERANRLPKSALKHIPVKRYSKADGYDMCAICLDDYVEGVKIRQLFCGHVYHCKCIDPWLLYSKRTCPVCKRRVLRTPGDDSSSDEEESETAPLLENERSQTNNMLTNLVENGSDDESVLLAEEPQAAVCSVREPIRRLFFVGSVDQSSSNQLLHLSTDEPDLILSGCQESGVNGYRSSNV